MIWVLIALSVVVGVKYYTALGGRNLERRLGKVRGDLESARQQLRSVREKEGEVADEEAMAVLRVRYMKELIEDLRIRLASSDEDDEMQQKKAEAAPAALMRF